MLPHEAEYECELASACAQCGSSMDIYLRKGHPNPSTRHMWAAPHASLITLLAIFTGLVIASLWTLRCLEGQMLYSRWGDYNTKISHDLLGFLTQMQGIGGSDLRQMTFQG